MTKVVKILVADTCKSSLVMTTEVFKDKIPGCVVMVASNGTECVELSQKDTFDMIVTDFDLPDVDGVSLTHVLRKLYNGPIVITAYPEAIVDEAIKKELFTYTDSLGWVSKPVKFENLEQKIDQFIIKKSRVIRRFNTDFNGAIVGKGEGRGKRAPKFVGNINTLSIKGASIKLTDQMKSLNIGDEITLSLDVPETILSTSETTESPSTTKEKKTKKSPTIKTQTTSFKAKIMWTNKTKTEAGVEFSKLSSSEAQQIENVLRANKA